MPDIVPFCPSPAAGHSSHLTRSSLSKRDYVLEHDDESMLKAMSQIAHEQDAIRKHNEALQAIEDAALAKALALSEETALQEARSRSRQSNTHIASSSSTTLEDKQSESHNIRNSVKRSSLMLAPVGISNRQAESHSNHAIKPRASMTPRVDIGSENDPFERRITSCSQARSTIASDEADVLSVLIANRAKSFSGGNSAPSQQPGIQSGSVAQTYVIDGPRSEFLDRNGPSAMNDDFDFSQELFSTVRFFAPPRKCCHCDEHVERVHNSATVMGLHAICTACRTKYCRGCFAPVGCPQDCAGGKECTVKNCCPGIHAIATFDVLGNFTNAFALALQAHHEETRTFGYIKIFMRQKDPYVRQFEHTFVQTLRTLPRLLRSLSAELHPPIARIVATSCLLRVMHDYLEHEDISNWMQHIETYLAILDTLKELLTCGLGAIFSEPFAYDKRNRGVPAGKNQVTERCLVDAVRHLDGHYKQIMALSARITFPATLLKMHKLSDGILYLLLQQIVN